jgi:hypothetical protein
MLFCAKAINRNVPITRVLDEWIFVETIHLRLLMEYEQNRRLKNTSYQANTAVHLQRPK